MKVMLRTLLRSQIIWVAAFLLAVYWTCAFFVPSNIVRTAMHSISFVANSMVVYRYLVPALIAFASRRQDERDTFIVGIAVVAGADAARSAWSAAYRILGKPLWMYENAFFYSLIMISIIGCIVLIISSRRQPVGSIGSREKIIIMLIILAGMLLSALLTYVGIRTPT